MKKLILISLVIFFAIYSSAWANNKQNIIEQIIKDPIDDNVWYGIYVGNHKIGWANISAVLNKDVFIINSNLKIMTEFQERIETTSIKFVETFDKNPPYLLLKYSQIVSNENKYSSSIIGNRENNDFVVKFMEGKSKRIKTLNSFDYSLYEVLATEIWLYNSPKIGEKIHTKDFDFAELRYTNSVSEVFNYENKRVQGVTLPYYTLKHSFEDEESKEPIIAYDFIGADGLSLKLSIYGMDFRLEDKDKAMTLNYVSNLFLENVIKTENKIPDLYSTDINKVVFEINGNYTKIFKESAGQKIINLPNGKKQLILYDMGVEASNLDMGNIDDYKLYSKETFKYPYRDPIITTLIESIPKSSDSIEEIFNIVEFVSEYVEDDYQSNAVSVFDIVQNKKGDCNEHSLLFATLARGMGYAVKEVFGWAYSEEDNGYVGHAWNEIGIIIGNKLFWLPVDSTYNEVDPFHIKANDDFTHNSSLPSLKLIEITDNNGEITKYHD